MDDLISRKSIMEKINKRAYDWRGSFSGDAYRNAVQMIKKETAVDAVEVIRCKDCKYFDPRFGGAGICQIRPLIAELAPTAVTMNSGDFCSYGERKEDG